MTTLGISFKLDSVYNVAQVDAPRTVYLANSDEGAKETTYGNIHDMKETTQAEAEAGVPIIGPYGTDLSYFQSSTTDQVTIWRSGERELSTLVNINSVDVDPGDPIKTISGGLTLYRGIFANASFTASASLGGSGNVQIVDEDSIAWTASFDTIASGGATSNDLCSYAINKSGDFVPYSKTFDTSTYGDLRIEFQFKTYVISDSLRVTYDYNDGSGGVSTVLVIDTGMISTYNDFRRFIVNIPAKAFSVKINVVPGTKGTAWILRADCKDSSGTPPVPDPSGTAWLLIESVWDFPPGSSSSESSFSSQSESPSSSSSSRDIIRTLRVPIINQLNNTLLPFTFIGEIGTSADLEDDSKLAFAIEASDSAYLDYTAIVERDNGNLISLDGMGTPAVYVPQDEDSYFQHRSAFFVDVIGHDRSGIRDVRTHVEPEKYEFEEVESSFLTPRFAWDNNTFSANVFSSFWVGFEDGGFNRVQYSANATGFAEAELVGEFIETDPAVNDMIFAAGNNKLYVSTFDTIYSYNIDRYVDGVDASLVTSALNGNNNSMVLFDDSIWSVQTYNGDIAILNPADLSQQSEMKGFDAPFKVVKSKFHNAHFAVGNHVLWKIVDDVQVAEYEVNDYTIVDFDILDSGEICLLLNGDTNDIIRILDRDTYSFKVNQVVTGSELRFCQNCGRGRFYILSEIDTGGLVYSAVHYLYDNNVGSLNGSLSSTNSSVQVATTTTTTTLGITGRTIEIMSPILNDIVVTGEQFQIKWLSTEALGDIVRLELYRDGNFHSVIVAETPNTGIFVWDIPSVLDLDDNYQVRATWLVANSDPNNYDMSEEFAVFDALPTTTTTTTEGVPTERSIGVVYDIDNDLVVFVTRSGLFGTFVLVYGAVNGLFETGATQLSAVSIGNDSIAQFKFQSKVRVFVGSQLYWSDKWDSGEVSTPLESMYYGAGNNLEPGEKYYAHIQVYSESQGWSELQINEFIMPK